MGTCAPSQNRPPPSSLPSRSSSILQNDESWPRIRDASLDEGNFYFVQEFQDIYTELYGAYLLPERVAVFVLQFKRFLYLVYKYHTSQSVMQTTREDIQLMHFPAPRLLASPIIDRMWRLLCSNTKLYRKFCKNSFGAFLDRDVLQSPPIEYYEATLKAYQLQFGEPNPSIWPAINTNFGLSSAYNGFVFMPASKFIEFHQYFLKKYPSEKLDEAQLEYARELILLREERRIPEKLQSNHAQFLIQVHVNASPEDGQAPVKLNKNNALMQRQKEEEEVEIEDLILDDQFEEEQEEKEEIRKEQSISKQQKQGRDEKVELKGEKKEEESKELEEGKQNDRKFPRNTNEQKYQSEEEKSLNRDQIGAKVEIAQPQIEEGKEEANIEGGSLMSKNLKENWQDLKFKLFSKLEEYRLEDDILGYFRMEHTLSPELADSIIQDYKRFLLLHYIAKDRETFIPSLWVKLAWDNHLVQTACYRRFCFDIFGTFIHSQHLPRQVSLDQRQKYIDSILSYKEVFGEYPSPQIWPDPETRFDYEEFYSSKYFNIYGYMYEVINKIEKKQFEQDMNEEEVKKEVRENYERQASVKSMRVASTPSRGRQFISINAK